MVPLNFFLEPGSVALSWCPHETHFSASSVFGLPQAVQNTVIGRYATLFSALRLSFGSNRGANSTTILVLTGFIATLLVSCDERYLPRSKVILMSVGSQEGGRRKVLC